MRVEPPLDESPDLVGVSASVRRSLLLPRPRLRGVMHRVAVPPTVVAGIWLVARAPAGADRLGAAIFAFGALFMFVASGIVHLRRWSVPVHPPKGLMHSLLLGLGWVPVMVAPDLFRALEPVTILLVVVQGVLYSGGALMLGAQWPDLSPRFFGYHEVWHTLVTAAVAAHFVLVAIVVV